MKNAYEIKLVTPEDMDYVGYLRRLADSRPSRGGPRQAGEYLGGVVEKAARSWIGRQVPLLEERILSWQQPMRNGRHGRLFRELDAVWRIDEESLCVFEIKFTYQERMEAGAGLKQLDIAADMLLRAGPYRYVLQRLVYIAPEPVFVLADDEMANGLPSLSPAEEFEELGVVWIPMDAIEEIAQELELELPPNWRETEAREGHIEEPEREEWKQYLEPDQESQEEGDGPLADALRRLLKNDSPDS